MKTNTNDKGSFKSIGLKLTSVILVVILLGLLVTQGISVAISANAITRLSLRNAEQNTWKEALKIDNWLASHEANIATLAASMAAVNDFSEEQQVKIFQALLKQNEKYYFDVYMGYPDGKANSAIGYVFDYSWWSAPNRGWYKFALTDAAKPHTTSPYIDAQTLEMCITTSAAVKRGGKLVGVVAADIFVSTIQEMVLSSDMNEKGYSALIDSNGDILVHPHEDFAPDKEGNYRNMATVKKGAYAALWEKITSSNNTVVKFRDSRGKEQFYTAHTLPSTGWYIVSVIPASVVNKPIASLLLTVIPVALAMIALVTVIIFVIISRSVSRRISAIANTSGKTAGGLTLSAGIGGNDEIELLVERLRVREIMLKRTQANDAAELRFDVFIKAADSLPQAFRMTLAVLGYQCKPAKITLVHAQGNDIYALSRRTGVDGKDIIEEANHYPHHAEVTPLMSGKIFVFFNGFALKERRANFAAENARAACLAPLTADGKTMGYVVIESDSEDALSVAKEEEFVTYAARELALWLSEYEQNNLWQKPAAVAPPPVAPKPLSTPPPVEEPAPKAADTLSAFRGIDGLEFDAALTAVGGMEDVYEDSARLFARLAPQTVEKMDGLLRTDLAAFAIEIHGIKGSLNNIGAYTLGGAAAEIEKSAKSGDIDSCEKGYTPFRESLVAFHGGMARALPARDAGARPQGSVSALRELLLKAKNAAESFDAYAAKDAMNNAAAFSYGGEIDSMIDETISFLESYDCESAAAVIDKIINHLGGSAG